MHVVCVSNEIAAFVVPVKPDDLTMPLPCISRRRQRRFPLKVVEDNGR